MNSQIAIAKTAVGPHGRKGAGHVYSRNGIWWIKFYERGQPHFESSESRRREDAQKLLNKRLAEVEEGIGAQHGRLRVEELLDDLLEFYRRHRPKSYEDFAIPAVKHLRMYWSNYRVASVTTEKLNAYQDTRKREGAAPATVNHEMALLRRAFRLALKATPRKVNPATLPCFPMLPENNVRKGFLLPEQYRRLLEVLPLELRPLLVVGYHVGCRRGELLSLRKEQVELGAKQITLYPGTTKNSEGRVLPIYGDMLAVLTDQIEGLQKFPKCKWVFHRNGKRIRSFRESWRLACERAGVTGLLFHDLRRSAIRNMRRAGISERIAMAISGHKTREVFDRYDIVDTADLEQAGAKLEKFLEDIKRD